jgi:hypothetical protein
VQHVVDGGTIEMSHNVQSGEPLPVWTLHVPGAKGASTGDIPRLTPYLPPRRAHRSAVIVCPGGGYTRRAEHEAAPVACWLNSLGIVAFAQVGAMEQRSAHRGDVAGQELVRF